MHFSVSCVQLAEGAQVPATTCPKVFVLARPVRVTAQLTCATHPKTELLRASLPRDPACSQPPDQRAAVRCATTRSALAI